MEAKKPHEQRPGQTKMCCFPSLWCWFANSSVFVGHCSCVFQTNRGCLYHSPSLSQLHLWPPRDSIRAHVPELRTGSPSLPSVQTQHSDRQRRQHNLRGNIEGVHCSLWGYLAVCQAGRVCACQPPRHRLHCKSGAC